jgi:hypothetical protein
MVTIVRPFGSDHSNVVVRALTKAPAMITIELYGVPRLRAGLGRVTVDAGTVAGALEGLGRACPALLGPVVIEGGRAVTPSFRLSLNGERFVSDPATALADGDVLILLSADVGG